jgi:hypothetical protein
MEHQTIIAYGAKFNNAAMTMGRDWGFDALHHHELSHEWWGNVITCSDWRDMWIHEGFGTYMQCLYLEETQGIDQYNAYLKSIRIFLNIEPVAPLKQMTTEEISMSNVYFKGAWILHTLRYLIGDEKMRLLLRRMIYPDPKTEKITDGQQVRFVSTNDFLYMAESVTGQDLDWFVNVYLRQPYLPVLNSEIGDNKLEIRWDAPDNLTFPMPVDVKIGETIQRVEVPASGVILNFAPDEKPEIDPDNKILFQKPFPKEISLNPSEMDRFTGTYESDFRGRNRAVQVIKEGQALFLKSTRLPKIQIHPSSEAEFFTKVSDKFRIVFTINADGEIESMTQNIFSQEINYKKMNQ